MIFRLIVGLIKAILLYKRNNAEPDSYIRKKIKAELDFPNYTTIRNLLK